MKNAEAWQSYSDSTKDATAAMRTFAGIGFVACGWFIGADGFASWGVTAAALALLAYCVTDVAQYVVASGRVHRWARSEEERHWQESGTIEGEYHRPYSLDQWPRRLFYAKFVVLSLALVTLGAAILQRA